MKQVKKFELCILILSLLFWITWWACMEQGLIFAMLETSSPTTDAQAAKDISCITYYKEWILMNLLRCWKMNCCKMVWFIKLRTPPPQQRHGEKQLSSFSVCGQRSAVQHQFCNQSKYTICSVNDALLYWRQEMESGRRFSPLMHTS